MKQSISTQTDYDNILDNILDALIANDNTYTADTNMPIALSANQTGISENEMKAIKKYLVNEGYAEFDSENKNKIYLTLNGIILGKNEKFRGKRKREKWERWDKLKYIIIGAFISIATTQTGNLITWLLKPQEKHPKVELVSPESYQERNLPPEQKKL